MKNKGGRKTLREEMLMHDVINLSWRTLWNGLRSDTVEEDVKLKIATTIASKAIPKDININMKDPFRIEIHTQPNIEQHKDITPDGGTVIEIQSNTEAS